jgi:hypothetical protein
VLLLPVVDTALPVVHLQGKTRVVVVVVVVVVLVLVLSVH